jgi:hypothetical protein
MRRALLVYLVEPFVIRPDDLRFLEHQNLKQNLQIASALGSAGYCVDVADVADRKFRPPRRYDLVVSHRVDLPDPRGMLDKAVRVYLATGRSHVVHNRDIRARYQALVQRRGRAPDPPVPLTEDLPFVRQAHAITGFGNLGSLSAWADIADVPLFPFNNYGYDSTRSTIESKDFARARSRFLFFGSVDQIRKGLDILLEVFARHPELELYVCSAFMQEESFVRCYRQELFHTSNIHARGLIRVNSEQFYDLTRMCAHVVLPSCSEGSPGSVIQCMHTGMIPIVTRECGMELQGVGTLLPDDSPATIERVILESAARPEGWFRDQARRTRRLAIKGYSEEAFVLRWQEIAHSLASLPARREEA